MDDRDLNQLLREWKAPDAPAHLRRPRERSWLRWLLTGTIRVPVPVAVAALLLAGFWIVWTSPQPMPSRETSAPRRSGELARYALTGRFEGFDAVLVELNFAPGASAPAHRHPSFILGYVVDGQMRSAINSEPDQIVRAGGTFFEPLGALHTTFGSASPDAPVRAVAFLVVPTGSRVTSPPDANPVPR